VTQEDYEEYKEGHEAGEEAAEEEEGASFGDVAEKLLTHLLIEHPLSGKSEMWIRGFEDGKEGTWDPPEIDEDEETAEETEEETD
jgi:hypothetical protein